MSKHTPGTWTVRSKAGSAGHGVSDMQGRSICAIPSNGTRPLEERQANSQIMAAAPKLLAALKKWERFARDNQYSDEDCTFLAETRAAIAEAEGAA